MIKNNICMNMYEESIKLAIQKIPILFVRAFLCIDNEICIINIWFCENKLFITEHKST